ncbi:MAG: FAD-dependent monooxygenase [Alphaproteobacteria bacterium]|nr:FAD-dependent monooxygenase [Alphaproteobacteria bacterium]
MHENNRVIVAGGGPAGLIATLALAQQDIPVLMLEVQPQPVDHRRATTFHPPTLEYLRQLGAVDSVIENGRITPIWQFRDRQEGLVAEFDLAAIKDQTDYPFRVQYEQMNLNKVLYRMLENYTHVDVRFGHEVLSANQDADGASVQVKISDGEQTLHGLFVVGADGSRSNVRRSLGIGFEGFTYEEKIVQYGTHFDIGAALPDVSGVAYISDPDEWCVLLHLPEYWRISFSSRDGEDDETALRDDIAEARMAAFLGQSGATVALQRSIWRIHQRVADDFRKGRIVLVGDAAHINSPMGGMGMNSGVHDAMNLADKLGQIWRSEADHSVLDRYTRQRRYVAQEDVRQQTIRNTKFLNEKDPAARRESLDAMRAVADNPQKHHTFLMNSSMLAGLRTANAMD